LRAAYQLSLDEFRGLYVSDRQVDELVNAGSGGAAPPHTVEELTQRAEELRREHERDLPSGSRWARLCRAFGLGHFERDALLLALAPEVEAKYEILYAYLNNDVTRRWPTSDLALRLFAEGPAQRLAARALLLPESTLFRTGLLRVLPNPAERPLGLSTGFHLTPSVAAHLLGLPPVRATPVAERIMPAAGWGDLLLSEELGHALVHAADLFREGDLPHPILVFEGRPGTGRLRAAEALCAAAGLALVHVDLEAARATAVPASEWVPAVALEQRLEPAGLYLTGLESWPEREANNAADLRRLFELLGSQSPFPIIVARRPSDPWPSALQGRACVVLSFSELSAPLLREAWARSLARSGCSADASAIDALAGRFVLTAGQVDSAATAAVVSERLRPGAKPGRVGEEALFGAARRQSDQGLGRLAAKVRLIHTWDDLVLPPATLRRVREVVAAARHQELVYSGWGFAHRIAAGRGVKALFTGSSGTGKTMTAGVLARELGLDLYKIDLAGVVSKYIGETEQNLDRIFHAAHSSNAVLFFDEADALFGKRSEVKDAHDRYANIEVSYLLQKMEDYEGIAVLASNLSHNIDQAFARRMHYVVEFPLPGEADRERLWRGLFPPEAPLAPDVDFAFLSRQFPLAGGDIKNVVLASAFLAAEDGGRVTMESIVKALARQLMRQGQVPSPHEFQEYYPMVRPLA
jgi:DNA polymerase III delta prime subunit